MRENLRNESRSIPNITFLLDKNKFMFIDQCYQFD